MFRRSRPAVFLLTVALNVSAGASVAADEPWLSKPYPEWDKKDIRRILNDSPWAQTVQVMSPWGTGSETGRTGRGLAPNYPSGPLSSDTSQSAPGQPSATALARDAYSPVVIRWASAVTTRAAVAQQKVSQGVMTAVQAATWLAEPLDNYEIVAAFAAVPGLPPVTDSELKAGASLRLKPSGLRLQIVRVEIHEASDSNAREVSFIFERNGEGGRPLISSDQAEAQFLCEVGRIALRANFRLQKMRTKNGIDL